MKATIIPIILLLTFGITTYFFHPVDYEKLANEITKKTAANLKDEKELTLIGTGGRMQDNISMMMMGFETSQTPTIENARELLILAVEEYLLEINSNEKFRPYLSHYPFTPKNIEIDIYFSNDCTSRDKIDIAAAKEGKLFYYVKNPASHTLMTRHEEPYEEALNLHCN